MSITASLDSHFYISANLRKLLFSFVWVTFFLNAIVLKEPAPCDLFMFSFIFIMPLLGMVRFTTLHSVYLIAWMVILSSGLIAACTHEFYFISIQHMVISAYLAVFSVVLAAFVTRNPEQHLKIIWNGYMCGAILAAVAGIIGYFDLIPGAFELFTKYSRARGTFKDPNVFGPFLVPAFLYCLHSLLTRGPGRGLISLMLLGLFLFGIMMCFSRGAWMLFAVASSSYIALFFITSASNKQRGKTIALCLVSLLAFMAIIGAALQSPRVQKLWDERASLNQSYDVGDQGRFSGHQKAINIIAENPIGIGALYFGYFYHHELPHNLYLSMFLSTGWIGGTMFLFLIGATLYLGGRILFRRTPWMHYHTMAFCTFLGLAMESYIIDSDHWRLLYILMGLIWGAYGAIYLEDLKSPRKDNTTRQSNRLKRQQPLTAGI